MYVYLKWWCATYVICTHVRLLYVNKRINEHFKRRLKAYLFRDHGASWFVNICASEYFTCLLKPTTFSRHWASWIWIVRMSTYRQYCSWHSHIYKFSIWKLILATVSNVTASFWMLAKPFVWNSNAEEEDERCSLLAQHCSNRLGCVEKEDGCCSGIWTRSSLFKHVGLPLECVE